MENKVKEELILFINEAQRLTLKSFYQYYRNNGICVSDGSVPENTPNIEQIEAYVLHFRKFIQKNERVSVDKINGYVTDYLFHDKVKMNRWNEIYETFKNIFDSPSLIGRVNLPGNEHEEVSIGDLIQANLYGDLSHLNKNKRILHEELLANKILCGLYQFEFITILFEAGELISMMSDFCNELLKNDS